MEQHSPTPQPEYPGENQWLFNIDLLSFIQKINVEMKVSVIDIRKAYQMLTLPKSVRERAEKPPNLEVWKKDSKWVIHGFSRGLRRNFGWSILITSQEGLTYGIAAYLIEEVEGLLRPTHLAITPPRDWVGLEFTQEARPQELLKAYTVMRQEQASLVGKWLEPFNMPKDVNHVTRLRIWLINLSNILATTQMDLFKLSPEQIAGIKSVRSPHISVEGHAEELFLGHLKVVWTSGLTLDIKASIRPENPEKGNPFTVKTAFGHITAK